LKGRIIGRTRPLQVVLSDEGMKALQKFSDNSGRDASQVIRDAFHLYLLAHGWDVNVNPVKPGQRAKRKEGKGQDE